jgi:lysozyme family protein
MAEFNIAFQKMLSHEGEYVNDPDDRGGETYKGIAHASHSNWPGWLVIDKYKANPDFPSLLEKNIDLQQDVDQFYWTNFWFPLNADRIQNQSIAEAIFDFGINAGIHVSIRMIQSLVGANIDGILGTETLNKLNVFDPAVFLPAFIITRIEYYVSLVKKRPLKHKYFYGWVSRTLDVNPLIIHH